MKNAEMKQAIKFIAEKGTDLAKEKGLNYSIELSKFNWEASKVVRNIILHSDKARSNYTKAVMLETVRAMQQLNDSWK